MLELRPFATRTLPLSGPFESSPTTLRFMILHRLSTLVLCLLAASSALASVRGRVVTADGQPVEHVRVDVMDTESTVWTDLRGEFEIEGLEPPTELIVSHPRFHVLTVLVPVGGGDSVEVILAAKQEIFEEIAVSANRGEAGFSPVSVASTVVEPRESTKPPSTLTEIVSQIPSVSENGQGGIFQTYSIRGVSRQRVMTLVSGMRIEGERRAGVSASFVDPLLIGSVDVVRGPSSTFWGSGALGGVVQLFPQKFEGWSVDTGYGSQGDERYIGGGWGAGGWSLGLAHRAADEAEAPDGEALNTGFQQTSGTLSRTWGTGRFEYEIQAIASVGRDIGKSNTDFPERTTIYPEENHLLVRFGLKADTRWSLDAWVHPNDLETRVEDEETRSDLANEAFDLGLDWQRQFTFGASSSARFGVDYFGRRSVNAVEKTTFLGPREGEQEIAGLEQKTLDDGSEDQAGLYGAAEWNVGKAVIMAGARYSWQRQQNADRPATDDSAFTGFAGLVAPLGAGFEVTANLGTGLRFPSISERYFSGVTGRGFVEGNPDLEPESSLNVDAGLRWYGQKLFVAGYVFNNDISDYIERVEVEEDRLTFVNLTEGTIRGVELDGAYQFDEAWSLSFGGHAIRGEDENGEYLADIPPRRLFAGVGWRKSRWGVDLKWEHRFDKSDIGSGEKPVPAVDLLSGSIRYEFSQDLALSLTGANLLGEEYFNSADRKNTWAPGRGIGLALSWRPAK